MSPIAPRKRFESIEEAEAWMETHRYSTHFVDEYHALVSGMVMGQLLRGAMKDRGADPTFDEVTPLMDSEGNYTQHNLVKSQGRSYMVTIEPYQEAEL